MLSKIGYNKMRTGQAIKVKCHKCQTKTNQIILASVLQTETIFECLGAPDPEGYIEHEITQCCGCNLVNNRQVISSDINEEVSVIHLHPERDMASLIDWKSRVKKFMGVPIDINILGSIASIASVFRP